MEPTAPIIYHYHPTTGELLGSGLADPDPLDVANWLVPANATAEPPPQTPTGWVACRLDHTRWDQLADNRGTLYSIATGEPYQHEQLGPMPEGFTTQPPPGPHHTWVGDAWVLDQASADTAAEYAAVLELNRLQAVASARIAPLQDAVDLDEATEAEQAALLAWKRYRIALNRIEQQEGYPHTIEWPPSPAD